MLTGDGGDESFGGYSRYRVNGMFGALDVIPGPMLRAAARAGRAAATPLPSPSRLRRRLTDRGGPVRSGPRRALRQPDDKPREGGSIQADHRRQRIDALSCSGCCATGLPIRLDRLLRTDLLTYLPEDLLVKMDRATMANSLEARSPLLDHKLVEFAARLPTDRKIDGKTTKVLLRAIAKRLMPAAHVDRPKMGFGVPIGDWLRGPLGDRFEEIVLAPDAALRDHLDQSAARVLLAAHRSHQAEHEDQLWSLLMFELWARRWLSVGSAEHAPGVGSR